MLCELLDVVFLGYCVFDVRLLASQLMLLQLGVCLTSCVLQRGARRTLLCLVTSTCMFFHDDLILPCKELCRLSRKAPGSQAVSWCPACLIQQRKPYACCSQRGLGADLPLQHH